MTQNFLRNSTKEMEILLIYLIIALMAEAKPIIKHLHLTKNSDKPFKIFSSSKYQLIISGIGKEKATVATSHLLTLTPPSENDFLFNIGICGAPKEFEIGEVIMINQISTSTKDFYPDMLLRHNYRESAILTVDFAQDEKYDRCVDMESYAVFKTALYFLKTSQLGFIKVVSDNFSSKIPTREDVNNWIEPHVKSFEVLFENAINLRKKIPLLSKNLEEKSIVIAEQLRLSHSQKLQLNDALIYYVLNKNSEPTLEVPDTKENKLQRNSHFELLISSLK